MKTGRHVNHHRKAFRQLIEGLGRNELATEGLDGQSDAGGATCAAHGPAGSQRSGVVTNGREVCDASDGPLCRRLRRAGSVL